MSITEILEELPRLNVEERGLILRRLAELDDVASPELLAAIRQAEASPRDHYISADELRRKVQEWATP